MAETGRAPGTRPRATGWWLCAALLAAGALGPARSEPADRPTAASARIELTAEHRVQVFTDLESALAAVARLRSTGWPAGGVTLQLPAGPLVLAQPLAIGPVHSGVAGAPLRIRGARDGTSVLSAARPVGPWSAPDPDLLQRLPAVARPHVRQARLAGATWLSRGTRHGQGQPEAAGPTELLDDGQPMPAASWPDEGFTTIERVLDDGRAVVLADAPSADWQGETAGWLHGYWGRDWADEWIALGGVPAGRGAVQLDGKPPLYGAQVGQRVRAVHVLAALDRPGEWYLDPAGARLLYWPRGGTTSRAEVTHLEHVVVVRGGHHVQLAGFALEGSRGDALVVAGGGDVRAERLTVRNAGGLGVRMSGVRHRLIDSDIRHTGAGGVWLWGGDRATLEPGALEAQGNRIRHVNRRLRTYRPAVAVGGVGNTVRGNLLTDAPHSAIIFWGNDHLIEFNVISHVAQETGDVGAIYAGNDWTARGTVIRHNHLHDIRGPGRWGSRGIYLDDQLSGTVVQGNLFVGVDRPVFIGGGRDNLVDNNLFVDSAPAIHLDRRGRTWQKARTEDPEGPLRRALRAVPFDRAPYADRYPTLPRLLAEDPGEPRGNVARRNVVVGGVPLEIEAEARAGIEIDRMFDEAGLLWRVPGQRRDPGRATDFEFDDRSPIWRDGLAPLRLREMACTRLRWAGAPGEGPDDRRCQEAAR